MILLVSSYFPSLRLSMLTLPFAKFVWKSWLNTMIIHLDNPGLGLISDHYLSIRIGQYIVMAINWRFYLALNSHKVGTYIITTK